MSLSAGELSTAGRVTHEPDAVKVELDDETLRALAALTAALNRLAAAYERMGAQPAGVNT